MKKQTLSVRDLLSPASVFAIVTIFLALIGFTTVAAGIIAKVFGVRISSGQQAPVLFLVVLLVLLAIWNGSNAVKANKMADRKTAILQGLVAGAITGGLVSVYSLAIGLIYETGADLRIYLSALSPMEVKYWLLKLPTVVGAVCHLAIFAAGGAAGGYLSTVDSSPVKRWFSRIYHRVADPVRAKMNEKPVYRWIAYALVAGLVILLPNVWGQYWNYVMGTVGIYVILGLGLNLIVGLSGQLVLGYVAFFAVGAYTAALLNAPFPHNLMWGFWIALGIGIVLAALSGLLIGLPILRLRGDYLAIVTLGFGEIIRVLLKSDLLTAFTGGPRGIQDIHGPELFGFAVKSDVDYMYLIAVAVVVAVFVSRRLQNSRVGRAWVSMREDETVAAASGVNVFKYKMLALALGAAFAGLAGVLFATRNQFTGPEDHAMMVSINVLCIVIVGGTGSIPGIFLGAFALKGLPEILREFENYRLLAFGALLVMMMIIRPQGLWPATRPALAARAERELAAQKPPEPPADEKKEAQP